MEKLDSKLDGKTVEGNLITVNGACFRSTPLKVVWWNSSLYFYPAGGRGAGGASWRAIERMYTKSGSISKVLPARNPQMGNTLVQENNGAWRKETVNTAAPRKITLMYLYNGPKSSFIMTQDLLEYSTTGFSINTSYYYLYPRFSRGEGRGSVRIDNSITRNSKFCS